MYIYKLHLTQYSFYIFCIPNKYKYDYIMLANFERNVIPLT